MKNYKTYYELLTADPYKVEWAEELYISEKDFYDPFSGPYVKLDNDKDFKNVIESREKIKQIRINGYAKSGKTVLCNSFINRYGYPDGFKYGFEEGEGADYGIPFTLNLMLETFFRQLWSRREDNDILDLFVKMGKELKGDAESEEWRRVLNRMFYTQGLMSRLCNNDKSEDDAIEDLKEWFFRSSVIDVANQWNDAIYSQVNLFINQKKVKPYELFMELLILDYLLRCSISLKCDEYKDKVLFCLLDNLDNLAEDTIVSLYTAIVHTVHQLEIFRRGVINGKRLDSKELTRYSSIAFVYLFPTREVTDRKLSQGLARISQREIQRGLYDHFTYDISSHIPAAYRIFAKRRKFWETKGYDSGEVPYFECLKDKKIGNPISELLNGNYEMILGTLDKVSKAWPAYYKQLNLIKESQGRKGLLIRIVLEYFKKNDIFDEPKYEENEIEHRLLGGRLGLYDLKSDNEEKEEDDNLVSLSRVLLTYLSNCRDGCESIKEVFKDFEIFDKNKICESLFALEHGNREIWRRLILFGNNIPHSVDDLYKQAGNSYLQNARASEVEICRAGRAYLNYIVPSFEFLSCRLNSIESAPPLFSIESIEGKKWKQTIEDVIGKIEHRSYNYSEFDKRIIADLGKKHADDKLPKFFFINDYKFIHTNEEGPQHYHLARMIFAQIGYIEAFRQYLLSDKAKDVNKEKYLSEESAISDNMVLISFIVRYLALFDKDPLLDDYIQVLNNTELEKNNYQLKLKNRGSSTCKDVHTYLVENSVDSRPIRRISDSFRAQGISYRSMMETILKIHNSNYKLVGNINVNVKHNYC